MTACVAQLRDDLSSSDSNSLNDLFLGWSKSAPQVQRVFRTFKPEVMDLKVGDTLHPTLNIQVEDAETPFYEGQEPRKRPNAADGTVGTTIMKDGKPVYRNSFVVAGEPNHSIIKDYTRENKSAVVQAFASAAAAEFSK